MEVLLTKRAHKSLRKVPRQVAASFLTWKREVEEHGIETVRKIPGYHDEPLRGKLRGVVRSVRMGLGFRAFYREIGGQLRCISVEEVNNHDYKEIERLFGL